MSEEREPIDAIVVGFDEQDRVLAQPTSSGTADPMSLVGKEVVYLDYNGNPWKGVVREAMEDVLVIEFEAMRAGQEIPGLGQGSLVRISV
jgi:hypothetical protein